MAARWETAAINFEDLVSPFFDLAELGTDIFSALPLFVVAFSLFDFDLDDLLKTGGGEGGILIADGLSVGDFEGVKVGSFDLGAMVGDPSGKAGQNVGQALSISSYVGKKCMEIES